MTQSSNSSNVPEDDEAGVIERQTLLSKYEFPVQFLEYDHISKCQNGRELEKILNVLRSGEEGFYPHLIEFAEKRLEEIRPQSKLLRKQCSVLRKNEIDENEWKHLSNDLENWVCDVKRKDQELDEKKTDRFHSDCEIRKQTDSINELTNKSCAKRISSTDYKSWDKYDPDTEILKMDIQDEKIKEEALNKKNEKLERIKVVKFNEFATEAEAEFEANRERERGNECFKAGELQNALQHYSNSIVSKPCAAAYTNRALIYNKQKKYKLAIDDCQSALKFEPLNFKAHLRLGQNYEALEQFQEAMKSIAKVIQIDPNNTTAQEMANRLSKKCGAITTKNTRFTIEDVEVNERNSKHQPIKSILKNKQASSSPKLRKIIAIPGTSGMPPPYYKIVETNDPEVIKREKLKIFLKPCLLHITTIHIDSDEEYDVEDNNYQLLDLPPLIITEIESNDENEKCRKTNNKKLIKKSRKTDRKDLADSNKQNSYTNREKSKLHTSTQPGVNNNSLNDVNCRGGSGEPCDTNHDIRIPTDDELHTPFTFTEMWYSLQTDKSYNTHAEILRKLNFERIDTLIGCKLDDFILATIINCLHKHFMVPSEINKVYSVLTNIIKIPRFTIILMFLEETVKIRIRNLIEFLSQHGLNLPDRIKNIYL